MLIDGEVLECDPPNRLVQTWRAFFDPETAAEARPASPGRSATSATASRVTVTHDVEDAPIRPRSQRQVQGGGGGWAWILSDLKTLLESGRAMGS